MLLCRYRVYPISGKRRYRCTPISGIIEISADIGVNITIYRYQRTAFGKNPDEVDSHWQASKFKFKFATVRAAGGRSPAAAGRPVRVAVDTPAAAVVRRPDLPSHWHDDCPPGRLRAAGESVAAAIVPVTRTPPALRPPGPACRHGDGPGPPTRTRTRRRLRRPAPGSDSPSRMPPGPAGRHPAAGIMRRAAARPRGRPRAGPARRGHLPGRTGTGTGRSIWIVASADIGVFTDIGDKMTRHHVACHEIGFFV